MLFRSATTGVQVSTITVVPVNDAPIVDLNGNGPDDGFNFSTSFTEGGLPVPIADQVDSEITDVDSTDLSQCVLRLVSAPDGSEETLTGTSSAGVTVSAPGTTLILSGTSSLPDYLNVIRSVVYENTDENPTTTDRQVQVTCTDDTGVSSNVAITTISVTSEPDRPVVDLDGLATAPIDFSVTFAEDGGPVPIVDPSDLEIEDLDSTQLSQCVVRLSPTPDGAEEGLTVFTGTSLITDSYDAASGRLVLSGLDDINDYQNALRTVQYFNNLQHPDTTTRTASFVCYDEGNQIGRAHV